MSNYIKNIKKSLKKIISELSENPSLFLKNPESDFTRNRKINFKTLVGITMNSGGCTMNKELLDYFGFNLNTPTVSAYTQQRSKVLPEAFEFLFKEFTTIHYNKSNLYNGYHLLACDGSNLSIAKDTNDASTIWKQKKQNKKVINLCHQIKCLIIYL